jgi:hypothetical protein
LATLTIVAKSPVCAGLFFYEVENRSASSCLRLADARARARKLTARIDCVCWKKYHSWIALPVRARRISSTLVVQRVMRVQKDVAAYVHAMLPSKCCARSLKFHATAASCSLFVSYAIVILNDYLAVAA